MKRLQAFKFRLKLTSAQSRDARRFGGCRRFVYNKGLDACIKHYAEIGKHLGYNALAGQLVMWKKDPSFSWLKDAPSQVLQQALKDLDLAFQRFFKGIADFPTFKKKTAGSGFRFPQGFRLDQSHDRILLPKMGYVRYRNSREILGTVKNVTLSTKAGYWFASIQTEREIEPGYHPATSSIGIDMGIKRHMTLSTCDHFDPLNAQKKKMGKLAKYQRKMSRQTKFGKNWTKTRNRLQKIHTGIANARQDFLHKTTTILSKNHALIVVEDLKVKNMSKSAKGSVETPGRNVRQKAGLNRSVLDQAWASARSMLEYKQEWRGGMLLAVPPQYTSQTCPACGHVSSKNRLTQSQFECVECGFEGNADHVGAINILERGHRSLACQANDATRSSATGTRPKRLKEGRNACVERSRNLRPFHANMAAVG